MTNSSDRSDPLSPAAAKWSEEGLAAVLLRLLGVYFTAWAFITGFDELVRLVVASREFGLNQVLPEYWTRFAYPAAELAVGFYLLIGGQWVFEKLLTPIARSPIDDPSVDGKE